MMAAWHEEPRQRRHPLCVVGLHRWDFGTAFDPVGDGHFMHVVTYAWCRRRGCGQFARVVDVERRPIPNAGRG